MIDGRPLPSPMRMTYLPRAEFRSVPRMHQPLRRSASVCHPAVHLAGSRICEARTRNRRFRSPSERLVKRGAREAASLFPYMAFLRFSYSSSIVMTGGRILRRSGQYFPRRARVSRMKVSSGRAVCTIIFRTIFFTWPPDCIKKIAYLLCSSVLAWMFAAQDPHRITRRR